MRLDKLQFLNKNHPKRMPVLPTTKEALGTVSQDLCEEIAHHWAPVSWNRLLEGPLCRPHLGVCSQAAPCSGTQAQPPLSSVTVCPCCSSSGKTNPYLSTSSLPEAGIRLLTFQRTRTSPLSWGPQVPCCRVSPASAPGPLHLSLCNDSGSNTVRCNPIHTPT